MSRIALGVEYKGTRYSGFQRQKTADNTIQARLEDALTHVANEAITIVCAGRTDAGVHATGQVIHFDTLAQRELKAWVRGVNTQLPDDIIIRWSKHVPSSFHARFSAVNRTYRYIFYSHDIKPGIARDIVTWTKYKLNLDAMTEAGRYLLGEHDFTSLRAAQCQAKNPVRTIQNLHFFNAGRFIVMEIQANAFLHHMVRNIAGVMMDIGRGKKTPLWMTELLALKDRTRAAATASPIGLYLVNVGYPSEFDIPVERLGPDFI